MMKKLREILIWIQQYNKALVPVLGMPGLTFAAMALVSVLQSYGIDVPFTAEQIADAVLWLIGLALAVGAGVYAVPNRTVKKKDE